MRVCCCEWASACPLISHYTSNDIWRARVFVFNGRVLGRTQTHNHISTPVSNRSHWINSYGDMTIIHTYKFTRTWTYTRHIPFEVTKRWEISMLVCMNTWKLTYIFFHRNSIIHNPDCLLLIEGFGLLSCIDDYIMHRWNFLEISFSASFVLFICFSLKVMLFLFFAFLFLVMKCLSEFKICIDRYIYI